MTCGICKSSAHLVGKVVIVTGGNSGIGYETALNLAQRGARVILACRSQQRGTTARDSIVKLTQNEDVHYRHLDFSSFESVRKFAEDINNNEKRLDILINNAGAGGIGNFKTEDGLHVGMQVNYFGTFLLTNLLLPKLKSSAPSRIISLSSIVHKLGDVNFDDLNMEKHWNDTTLYNNTKLFINLMTLELSERLKGSGVTVNSLHPGVAATNLFRNVPTKIARNAMGWFFNNFFKNSWDAAQTSIYLAVSPDVRDLTGKYFADCKETKPSARSLDRSLAKKLWLESEKLVKLS